MGHEVRTLLWAGTDEFRAEIACARVADGALRASGTQLGVHAEPYELRYSLEPERLQVEVDRGPSLVLDLKDADAFDLGFSPLFNSIPVLRDRLHLGGNARDYVMLWVDVPSLEVRRSEQRYTPLEEGVVRYSSGSFVADIRFDDDGFVAHYPGLAKRVA
jgi:uncharacterized protein